MKYLPLEKVDAGHTGYQQRVKEANIKRIFDLVRANKCKSRAEIVRSMNLSATSVSVLVEELTNRKLIDETGPTLTSLPGRRPISLQLNRDAHHMAIFSFSHEGVRYALLNLACEILENRFFPLDSRTITDADPAEAYSRLLDDILRKRSKRFDPTKAIMVGASFPGIYIERDQLFRTSPALGFSLSEESIRHFHQRVGLPVYLLNSTRSMAYAEKKYLDGLDPTAPETQDLIFVRIQEGINCAIIADGNIYPGPYNVSGEIGHYTIDYQGRPCPCGNQGCLERYVNLNAILEDAREAALGAGIKPPETLSDLAQRYADTPALMASVRRSAQLLAFGLYSIMCSTGMRRVVLGGGIEILGEPFLQEVYHALMGRTLLIRRLDLSYAKAGPDAEILGVAEHYLDKVFTITV